MPVRKGCDASTPLACHAAALKAQGFDFVMRYYSHDATKNLTPGEARALCGAGLQIGVVWESCGVAARDFSAATGSSDAGAALRQALALGQPGGSALYFAVDFDPLDSDLRGNVHAYFESVAKVVAGVPADSAHYTVGVYGSGATIAYLRAAGLVGHGWLSQSTGFRGSRGFTDYDLRQSCGESLACGGAPLAVDLDETNADGSTAGLFFLA